MDLTHHFIIAEQAQFLLLTITIRVLTMVLHNTVMKAINLELLVVLARTITNNIVLIGILLVEVWIKATAIIITLQTLIILITQMKSEATQAAKGAPYTTITNITRETSTMLQTTDTILLPEAVVMLTLLIQYNIRILLEALIKGTRNNTQ